VNKTRKAVVALGVAIPFGVVMLLDPKEAVDNPHTHQEAPSAPMLDCEAPIISTFTGTMATISRGADIPYITTAKFR
jgi:hypothetical protein